MHHDRTIVVSNICNNNCINCLYLFRSREKSVITDSLLKQRKSILGTKTKTINLTGGEPTLNPDLFKILKEIRDLCQSAEISILSNGRMFSYGGYLAQFKKLNLGNVKVVIPLYGHTPLLHDSITRTKGSFIQTVTGIKNLLTAGFKIEVRVIINSINHKNLEEISKFIFTNFNDILCLVFVAMEINREIFLKNISVKYSNFRAYLEDALNNLHYERQRVKLFHFPLCSIEQKYWDLICHSIESYKLSHVPECNNCGVKNGCMGILKTYLKYFGNNEFKRFKTV